MVQRRALVLISGEIAELPTADGLAGSGGGAMGYIEAALSADVQLAVTNQWYNGPSVSLDAGTWLVSASLTQVRTATTAENIYGRVTDGTTHHVSTQGHHASAAGAGVSLAMTTLITLAATTIIKLQAATSAGSTSSLMKAALAANGSGNNATQIAAIRVA